MAITTINSLAIPAGTVVSADLTYPLTGFSSTGIDDNATSTAITINSSQNVGIGTTSPAGPLHIQSATNRTIILDGTVATGSFTWQSIRRSGTEKWRWFLENDDDVTLYADVNSTGSVMRWGSDGNVGIGTANTSNARATIVSAGVNGADEIALAVDHGDLSLATGQEILMRFGQGGGSGSLAQIGATYTGGTFDGALLFKTNSSGTVTERMRIDSSGNVGIGVSSITNPSGRTALQVSGGSQGGGIYFGTSTTDTENARVVSDNNGGVYIATATTGGASIALFTANAERMRIDSSGNLLVGRTSGIGNERLAVKSTALTCTFYSANSTANGTLMSYYSDVGGTEQQVAAMQRDGDIANTNNSYGALSDERLKSNIVDASSQIDDIMAVQVRSYTLDSTGDTHIGVVAQELEASGMSGLVKENEDGMKSVKYSILYMKAIKALQEAVTRIETLEAEVAALKGA